MSGYLKQRAWVAAALFVCLMHLTPAQAASFECTKVENKVEHIICDNPELSKLDEALADRYKVALQGQSKSDEIRQAQKQWMKERNGCTNEVCISAAYQNRIEQLRPILLLPQVSQLSAHSETVCLVPKIDWRNYEWTLITGNGEAICEEMLAYVKSRPNNIAPPTCPDERLPPNGNWTRPEIKILGEEEKQSILKNIPERWRQKGPGGPVSYEWQIKNSGLLRVIRGDITRDGIPESFLALGQYENIQQICEKSKRCAVTNRFTPSGYVNEIDLKGDSYDLLPMNDEGTQVNWLHRTAGSASSLQLMLGELIFYQERPYWLSRVVWGQALHDDFVHNSTRPNYSYSAIFSLAEIGVAPVINGNKTPHFKDVTVVAIEHDPESNRVCRFGYFHRNNLKLNPPNQRR